MNFNKIKKLILTSIGIFLVVSVQAGELKDGDIAVLDVAGSLLSTEYAKQQDEELQASKEWKEMQEDVQLKVNEFNEIQANLEKEGPTMSDEERMDAQKRLASLNQDLQFLNQKMQGTVQELQRLVQNEQFPKFQKVVTELVRAKGIKMVLRREAVLAVDEGDPLLNLTPEVVELLNQTEE